jgi:hypothetical protein
VWAWAFLVEELVENQVLTYGQSKKIVSFSPIESRLIKPIKLVLNLGLV